MKKIQSLTTEFQLNKKEINEIGNKAFPQAYGAKRSEIRHGLKIKDDISFFVRDEGADDAGVVNVILRLEIGCQTFEGLNALELIKWALKK